MERLAFSKDNRLLAGLHDYTPEMCVWEVRTGERLGRDLSGHWAVPSELRFFAGDEPLATSSDDSRVYVWNISSSAAERFLACVRSVEPL